MVYNMFFFVSLRWDLALALVVLFLRFCCLLGRGFWIAFCLGSASSHVNSNWIYWARHMSVSRNLKRILAGQVLWHRKLTTANWTKRTLNRNTKKWKRNYCKRRKKTKKHNSKKSSYINPLQKQMVSGQELKHWHTWRTLSAVQFLRWASCRKSLLLRVELQNLKQKQNVERWERTTSEALEGLQKAKQVHQRLFS